MNFDFLEFLLYYTFDNVGGLGRGLLVDGVARVVDVRRSCFGVFITLK